MHYEILSLQNWEVLMPSKNTEKEKIVSAGEQEEGRKMMRFILVEKSV